MTSLWILHRDQRLRAALARLAGMREQALVGSPGDAVFETAPPPRAVVLGVAGDFERELEFVHRFSARLRDAGWILVAESGECDEVARLFDTIPARILAWPPTLETLRAGIDVHLRRRRVDPLSERRARDALAGRFARWFADLQLAALLRALDPRLARVPILVRGERGTGRHLLARYVHAFGATTGGFFVPVPCTAEHSAERLLDALATCARGGQGGRCAIWLQDVDALAPAVQRRVQDWVEFGPPEGAVRAGTIRWIAGASDEPGALDPGLARALSGVVIAIPPLRERADAVGPFAAETARAWCELQGEPVRRFSPDALETLREYPWPGNLAELESVVMRTLSATNADPIPAEALRFEGEREEVAAAELELDADREGEWEETAIRTLEPWESPPWAEAIRGAEPPERTAPDAPATGERKTAERSSHAAESVRETTRVEAEPAGPAFEPAHGEPPADDTLPRLAGALAHEVRNPLVAIRTLSELLPERYEDPEFRERFAELVTSDVERIERVVRRLAELASLEGAARQPVDVVSLLETLLDERRAQIVERRLLVLKELDYTEPFAVGDPSSLREAFEGLLDKALEWMPDGGDLFLASRRHAEGLRGGPTLRVLLRFRDGRRAAAGPRVAGVSQAETALDLVLAEAVVRGLGGALTLDTSAADETLVVLDLPARRG